MAIWQTTSPAIFQLLNTHTERSLPIARRIHDSISAIHLVVTPVTQQENGRANWGEVSCLPVGFFCKG